MTESLTKHLKDGKRSLDSISDVQHHSSLVTCILGLNPGSYTLNGTNTYLVGSGEERILIDTGEGRKEYVQLLKTVMEQVGCKKIKLIIITHWHYDHIGGVPSILESIDDSIPVYKYLPDFEEGNQGMKGPYEFISKEDICPIENQQIFECEGATLKAFFTPGHANDHVCLWLEEENSLFSGDNVLGTGTGVFRELTPYINSLSQMKLLKPKALYPGHGPMIADGVAKLDEYISHRQKRIEQVRAYLKLHSK